jgi:GNAT superfamily N-acetyltransferase
LPSFHATIRPFASRHYPSFTALWNEAYPELKRTELEMRLADFSPSGEISGERWTAEKDGVAVGFAGFEPLEHELADPRKLQLHLMVAPEYRRQGIGSTLYQHLLRSLEGRDVTYLRSWVRRDREESLRFLERHGFVEQMRTIHSSLDTAGFELERLEKYVRRLTKYGYEFRSFAELAVDPERNRKAYDVHCEVMSDIPAAESRRTMSLAEYEQKIAESPEFFRSQFFAVHNGRYVGICILLPKDRSKRELYADTLGVRRAYRGRGIAQALSHKGIEYARKSGYSLISADSFVENHRINALLDNLGFDNKSEWSVFSKSPS